MHALAASHAQYEACGGLLQGHMAAAAARLPARLGLRDLWRGLLAGRYFVSGSAYAGECAFVTIEERVPATALDGIDAACVERALKGERQKTLALELGVSASRITMRSGAVLAAIGLERSLSRVSILLVMAVHAAGGMTFPEARVDSLPTGDEKRFLVSVENPARALRRHLSPAEFAVARLTIEGRTHEEIVWDRKTASRTVSNQLASIFRKLRVSGRRELRARAVQESALSVSAA